MNSSVQAASEIGRDARLFAVTGSALALGVLALGGSARAQGAAAPTGPTLAWNFGAATDYSFRGISQTDNHVQGFVGADLSYHQAYAGVWTSNVDFSPFGDPHSTQEVDVYGGYKPSFGGFNFDVGAISYLYVNNPGATNYWEFYGKGARAFGPATLGASVYYSPRFPGFNGLGERVDGAVYYEANAAYALDNRWSVSGAVGRQQISNSGADYTTWNLGPTYAINDHISADLRYWDTNQHDFGSAYKSKVILTLKALF